MNSPTTKTTTMTPMNNLAAQLGHLGLRVLPTNLDDFVARATQGHWSPRMLLEQLAQAETEDRSRRSLEQRLRVSGIKKFKPMAVSYTHLDVYKRQTFIGLKQSSTTQ